MGMNTAMIIRNDFLHEIEKDAEFGKKVADAVRYAGNDGFNSYHRKTFDMLQSSHAHYAQVVVVGGNTLRRLGGYAGTYTNSDEEILRNIADSMGFRLVKKPAAKKESA